MHHKGELILFTGGILTKMDKEKNSAEQVKIQDQTAETNYTKDSKTKDTELAEELGSNDFRSAFKNPVTGEERLY